MTLSDSFLSPGDRVNSEGGQAHGDGGPALCMRNSHSSRSLADYPSTRRMKSDIDALKVSVSALHFMAVIKRRHAERRHQYSRPNPAPTLAGSCLHILAYSKLNVLLAAVPFALLAKPLHFSAVPSFLLNFVAIIPLAQLLGAATEEVALYTNEVIGGLLNATLGNATEVIISIFAIRAKLLRVVQVSLLGSILSNLLLVTGCSFFVGGLRFRMQRFSEKMASINCSLLKMAVLGLVIPTAYGVTMRSACAVPCRVSQIAQISHGTAIILFLVYMALMLFQLRTHAYLNTATHENEPYPIEEEGGSAPPSAAKADDDAEDETPEMTLPAAILSLVIVTVLIAYCSEMLVDTLEVAAKGLHLSDLFIGLVLLPIVGNAAEHATAVVMAWKGKTDLALGVALGSSVQIALCVIPGLVLVAWAIGAPLTLDFGAFEATILLVTALVATSTIDANATWLDGLMLMGAYCVVAIVYFYKVEVPAALIPRHACVCGEACCIASPPSGSGVGAG
jgi:Ca2+:H+ antiporter